MSTAEFQHLRLSMVDDVVVVEVLSKDLLGPEMAQELGAELSVVAAQDWASRMLLDFRRTVYLSSTGFAVLFKLASGLKASGREMKICNMHEDVRIGADILGLGRLVEFYDDEKSALAAFSRP